MTNNNNKRRRLTWDCHLNVEDTVAYSYSGVTYLGKVTGRRLRQFGDNYSRVIISVGGNYVSHSNFNHLRHRCEESIFLQPKIDADGGFYTEYNSGDRLVKVNDPLILNWRDNLKKNQEVWYKNIFKAIRTRLRCVVVDVHQDSVTIQPKYSKLLYTVPKQSETIQPVLHRENTRISVVCTHDYLIQTPMNTDLEQKDKYLGCYCSISARDHFTCKGFIVDVDYIEGGPIYCYVEDRGASRNIPFMRYDTHLSYVRWVRASEITIIDTNNMLSERDTTLINNKRENIISTKWEHDFSSHDLSKLKELKEKDLGFLFSYILKENAGNHGNVLCSIGYYRTASGRYSTKPMYELRSDNYDLDGYKKIMVAKQDFFISNGNMTELTKTNKRLDVVMRDRQAMNRIFHAEEVYRKVPIFTFDIKSIELTNTTVTCEIGIIYNNLFNIDVCAFSQTAVNLNALVCRPIMNAINNTIENRRYSDVYDMKRYAKKNTRKFKTEMNTIEKETKIPSLKNYQNWMVNRMVNEENSENALSEIFSQTLSDTVSYNRISGFTRNMKSKTNGGILSLDVGWGKTVIMIELILRQGGCTLICAPLTLIDQWKSELGKFAPQLSCCEYYGRNKREDADVVFTTYGTLRQTHNDNNMKYYERVIFDESHLMKNPASQRAIACFNVAAKNRWCVTATPYSGNNGHLQTQLRMLKIQPFNMNINLMNNDNLFGKLFSRIMFSLDERKLKKMGVRPIEKKVKAIQSILIDTDEDVKLLVDTIKTNDKTKKGLRGRMLSVVKPATIRIQMTCIDPSMFPLSVFAKKDETKNQEVTKDQLIQSLDNRTNISNEYKKSVIEKLNNENDGICCVCLDTYTEPSITPCLHVFCHECIKKSIAHKPKCPQCRQNVTEGQLKKLVQTHVTSNDVDNIHYFTDILGNSYSIEKSVKEAYERMKTKTPKKYIYIKDKLSSITGSCVIFSQYAAPLQRLKKYLSDNDIESGLINGKTTRKQRSNFIKRFGDGTLKVCLLSTRTASVGINLQEGSTIIFLEPILALSDQVQSIGRLHRIGQKNDIDVIQLSSKMTYEKGMCDFLKDCRKEQELINRNCRGRSKKIRESDLKFKMYRHILS